MTRKELIKEYLEFFKGKKHKVIPGSSLIPENDPSVLFTTAGMHPLVPYLLGQKHPLGKRLCDVQECIRTGDINSVGDDMHLTFFEMLGNWSLGDYFKKEAIGWSFEFLTKHLGINTEILHVTVFEGNKDAPCDEESAKIWHELGIPKERIYFMPKEDNFWGPAGEFGPCGPCTEMFIDTGKKACSKECKPGCSCGKFFEVWNDVFMEYNKTKGGFGKLKQRNVDTGMGVERTLAMLEKKKSIYETETFIPIIKEIKKIAHLAKDDGKQARSIRIIADHIKAAVFILAENITPSNIDQGYVLRRMIRRAIRHGRLIGIRKNFTFDIARVVISIYKEDYSEIKNNESFILAEIAKEEKRFMEVLEKGMREFEKIRQKSKRAISGKDAFLLFQSYGFPIEMTRELAEEHSLGVDERNFVSELMKHQQLSRQGAEKKFRGGLSEQNAETTKLHTATHLLNQALREVLGKEIKQRGSNITPERLRFDFNYDKKLTEEQIKKVEGIVNEKIKEALHVIRKEMTVEEAIKQGAQAVFTAKYGEKVSVYSIGNYSKEICAGPHAKNTKQLGHFEIIKEESIAAGIRRIKAILK